MASQLYQVRNLYVDQTFGGFELRAGKKARVRVDLERADTSQYRAVARLVEGGGYLVAEGSGESPDAAFAAVVAELRELFNFVARIDGAKARV